MAGLYETSQDTIKALQKQYADEKHQYACQTGALHALVSRIAIEIDIIGDGKTKENIKQILLDYQSR